MAHQQRHSPSSFRSWKTASRGNRSRDSMDSPTPSSHLDDMHIPLASPRSPGSSILSSRSCESRRKLSQSKALSRRALLENDSLVYLDGPQVYTCGECRTHLTSHDDIISKSFHGRHGRAYLFDQCVNINTGPAEDRQLITGLHSVSDIFCKRCNTLIGWTYSKAYEPSQKYKEGKFIIEKINLHIEESDHYVIPKPAGERDDKQRLRTMSWGSERSHSVGSYGEAMQSSSQSARPMSPQTPPARSRYTSGAVLSPKSPSQIVYEYRQRDD